MGHRGHSHRGRVRLCAATESLGTIWVTWTRCCSKLPYPNPIQWSIFGDWKLSWDLRDTYLGRHTQILWLLIQFGGPSGSQIHFLEHSVHEVVMAALLSSSFVPSQEAKTGRAESFRPRSWIYGFFLPPHRNFLMSSLITRSVTARRDRVERNQPVNVFLGNRECWISDFPVCKIISDLAIDKLMGWGRCIFLFKIGTKKSTRIFKDHWIDLVKFLCFRFSSDPLDHISWKILRSHLDRVVPGSKCENCCSSLCASQTQTRSLEG